MTSDENQMGHAAEVVLTVHVFVKDYKRVPSLKTLQGRERTEPELQAYDNNWRLSRKIKMPYRPKSGTRIAVPLAPEDEKRYDRLLNDVQRTGGLPLGVPQNNVLFKIAEERVTLTARLRGLEAQKEQAVAPSDADDAALIAQALADIDEALRSGLLTDGEKHDLLARVVESIIPETIDGEDGYRLILRPMPGKSAVTVHRSNAICPSGTED